MRLKRRPKLSVVIVVYDMEREAPRTIRSLSREIQLNVSGIDYEIVVVDNASPRPFILPLGMSVPTKLIRLEEPNPSPAKAANIGIDCARGELVCLILDGARMVTPGLIQSIVDASALGPMVAITTMAWHLGPKHQSESVLQGYSQSVEDELLDSIHWPDGDGYQLFDISAVAGSNRDGWFGSLNESCCLTLNRALWSKLGGMDENFCAAGGGLVNLDLFARLLDTPGVKPVLLLGEGSFHQLHGGASSNSTHSRWDEFHAEYVQIRNENIWFRSFDPLIFGRMRMAARRFIQPTSE